MSVDSLGSNLPLNSQCMPSLRQSVFNSGALHSFANSLRRNWVNFPNAIRVAPGLEFAAMGSLKCEL